MLSAGDLAVNMDTGGTVVGDQGEFVRQYQFDLQNHKSSTTLSGQEQEGDNTPSSTKNPSHPKTGKSQYY